MLNQNTVDQVFETVETTLEDLVRIPSVSNNNVNPEMIEKSAQLVRDLFENAGIQGLQICTAKTDEGADGNPAIIGELGANQDGSFDETKPTVLLYAHHDVQPANGQDDWKTDPFTPTIIQSEDGRRLFGRGANDCGAGIVAHLGALRYFQKEGEQLPVNVRIFIEGEEEIGSPTFANFVEKYKTNLKADAIVVADSGNWAVGIPAITATLRGVSTIDIDLQTIEHTVHSGEYSGPLIDANSLLMQIISTCWDEVGNVAVQGILGGKYMPNEEPSVDYDEATFRKDAGILDGLILAGEGTISGRRWTKPTISVIGFDATPVNQSSNVLANRSKARISLRVAPGQNSKEAAEALIAHLHKNNRFNAKLDVKILESGPAFKSDLESPGISAFTSALKDAFGVEPVISGMGGSIPFTASLKNTFPDADIIISGVGDPDARSHSSNESSLLDDLKKVMVAEILLLKKMPEKYLKKGNS